MYLGRKLDPYTNSSSPDLLDEELHDKLNSLLESCRKINVDTVLGTTLRGPGAQGRLWCASKTPEEVQVTKEALSRVAPYLASFLHEELGRSAKVPCNSLPGNSWHQFGSAVHVYPLVDGRPKLRTSLGPKIAELAKGLGLRSSAWGIDGADLKIYHLQLSPFVRPMLDRDGVGTWAELDKVIGKIYGP